MPIKLVRNVNALELIVIITFLSVLLCTGLIYSKGLHGIFLLDDHVNIRPTLIHEFNWENIKSATLSNSSGTLKRPISALSFALTSLAHGDYSWGFKYHNLLIHLLTGLIILLATRKLCEVNYQTSDREYFLIPLFVSCLWLLHPLHVSTVLYAVQRMTQLSTLFTLLALLSFLNGRLSLIKKQKFISYFIWYPILFIFAILSKENGVLLVLYIPLANLLISRSKYHNNGNTNFSSIDRFFTSTFSYIPIVIGSILFAIKRHSFLDYSSRSFEMGDRLLSQIGFICLYLQQLVLPRLSSMGLYFDDIAIPREFTGLIILQLLFLLTLIAFGFRQTLKGRLIGFGILLFFVGHALESTIIPLELAFEHRNYLPSIGVFIVLGVFLSKLSRKRTLVTSASLIALILIATLFLRVSFWSDGRSWQKTALAFHPRSERTQLNFIFEHHRDNNATVALAQAKKAVALLPDRISLKFIQLFVGCSISNEDPDNIEVIDDIYKHLKTQKLTVLGFNGLASLIQNIIRKECTSISFIQLENILNTAHYLGPQPKSFDGNLWFLKGLMASARESSFEASEYFREGYKASNEYRLKLAEIKSLLFSPNTRKTGTHLLDLELEKSSFVHRKEVERMKKKVDDNDFVFVY